MDKSTIAALSAGALVVILMVAYSIWYGRKNLRKHNTPRKASEKEAPRKKHFVSFIAMRKVDLDKKLPEKKFNEKNLHLARRGLK